MTDIVEPGRHVTDTGRIVYNWPPEGRFADLWRRLVVALPGEQEKLEAAALLARWEDEVDARIVAIIEDDDEVDVEPDWNMPAGWLNR